MNTINVAIIGFGASGRFFHQKIIEKIEGYKIVKILSSRHDFVKEHCPHVEVCTDISQIIEDENVHLVINTAPNTHHFIYTYASLRAGKHVVVEKPFVLNVQEGKQLIAEAKKNKVLLTVYQNRRLDSDFLTLKNAIEQNQLGEIKQFESHFDRYRPNFNPQKWREHKGAGNGIFFDLGVHLIDQVLVLFGGPEKVFADIETQKDTDSADDYFHVVFYYDKLRVILHGSSFANTNLRFLVHGEKGTLVSHGKDGQEEELRTGQKGCGPNIEVFLGENVERSKLDILNGSYVDFYKNLKSSIQEGTVPAVDPSEALKGIELIDLCFKSSKQGRVLEYVTSI